MKGVIGKNPREFDQFFTKDCVAEKCVNYLESIISCDFDSFDCIVEPSFGQGAFVKAISNKISSKEKLIYVDIDSADEKYRYDFLKDNYTINMVKKVKKKCGCLTIGNPPFGKNSSLAIAFFNKAAEFSDVIAFISLEHFVNNHYKIN